MVLKKGEKFSEVQRVWTGETCCIIGGGKSLTREDVDLTRGLKVIAVNNSYQMCPWADVCYFADARWHEWHKGKDEFKSFAGQKCSIETGWASFKSDIHYLRNLGHLGFSTQPDGIHTLQNSGAQAMNIAFLAGVKRMLLLGFDMKPGYWHGGHPLQTPDSIWGIFLKHFSSVENQLKEAGVEVINCSPGSALTRWPMKSMEEALEKEAA